MSIADDIKKVMRVHSFECLSDSEIAELAGDLAPRLAYFAQQVMPLVEAAERYRRTRGVYMGKSLPSYEEYMALMASKQSVLESALALNLEVPR